MNVFEKFKQIHNSAFHGASGDTARDDMIESSRAWTSEYQIASQSSARNTATEMRCEAGTDCHMETRDANINSEQQQNYRLGKNLTARSRKTIPPLPGVPIP